MKKYFVFFAIAWIIFVSHAIYTRHAVYGDGNGYYAYTQALYFDKSLDFTNVYNFLSHFQGRTGEFSRLFWDTRFNPYSIGTGIAWLPSMLLMSIFSKDRFSLIYELGPGLSGIIFMLLGLYFIEKYLSRHFPKNIVFWTILILFFGSNVFYYTTFEPALSHQPAFFLISLLLYLTDKKQINSFVFGVLSGLLISIRIGDAVLLIPILLIIINKKFNPFYFVLGGIAGYAPQLINQYVQFHNILNNPYISGQNGLWNFNPVNMFSVLFSPKKGIFIWTPLYVLALYGLIKSKRYVILLSIFLLFLEASFWPGGLSAGYGIRVMFSSVPYLSMGVAQFLKKFDLENIIKTFSIFALYNFLILYGFYFLGWKNLP